ncbi:MAG: YceI family protein [Pyrinomonadaceae bacterium]
MKRVLWLLFAVAVAGYVIVESVAVEPSLAERFKAAGAVDAGESGTYNFDKAHSFIGFKVRHNGLIEVPGFFRDFTGTVMYDAKDVAKSSVTFTAKMTSVDTGVGGRDNHLRSADFFDVEKHPEMTFSSTKVAKNGKGWLVTGDLTMKGVTKPVSIPFNITGFLPGNQRNGPRMGITGETTVNRRDFGVNYGTAATLGDDVKVVLQIEAVQPKAPAGTTTASE